ELSPSLDVSQVYVREDEIDTASTVDGWRKKEGEELDPLLAAAEVLFTFRFPIHWLAKAPRLKWVQLASAGSDFIQREGLFVQRPDLLLTTASGVHEVPISEHIIASILHFSRGLNIATRNQAIQKWERYKADEIQGKMVCFVGYGPIARRAATLCRALGMRVTSVRASIAEQQPGFEAVERFYPPADLNHALSEADYVVVAAPRTKQTEKIIGAAQLDAMKETAVLVNISRGALVDEPALIEALQEGKINGAALDVFAQEPLPEGSPLWDMPNVLVTPHISGSNPHYDERVTDLFRDNLRRYMASEPLRNLVDKDRGY
ncbi:MAG: D-2-hydroxyacid dehydrogenase, partial [Chloroflexia bacterium]